MHALLVGAGNMSIQYAKVLEELKVDYSVISRGTDNAALFEEEMGRKVMVGGLEKKYESLVTKPTHAIVATNMESLESNALYLLEKEIKHLLIEKPGSVSARGFKNISNLSQVKESKTYIAYNRRFYSSVIEAEKRIQLDGGLKSFLFEFTEWGHYIKELEKSEFDLNNWFIGNSTHVIDMAFAFGGKPRELSSYVSGDSKWHPKGIIYTGAGITEKDILFSYHANWEAPGSWKLELLTNQYRYIFRPLEKLKIQKLGSLKVEHVNIDDSLDIKFKAGIYEQVRAFLFSTTHSSRLLSINDALGMMDIYLRMRGDEH